jgi:hypothetical protein
VFRAYFAGTQAEMWASELIEIQKDLLRRLFADRLAAEDRILPAGFQPLVVEPGADVLGYGFIGLVGSTKQLEIEAFLESVSVLHGQHGVVVLGFEVLKDGWMVAVLEPVELVFAPVAAPEIDPLELSCAWWIRKGNRAARGGSRTVAQRQTDGSCARREAAKTIGIHGALGAVQRNYPGSLSQVKPIERVAGKRVAV